MMRFLGGLFYGIFLFLQFILNGKFGQVDTSIKSDLAGFRVFVLSELEIMVIG